MEKKRKEKKKSILYIRLLPSSLVLFFVTAHSSQHLNSAPIICCGNLKMDLNFSRHVKLKALETVYLNYCAFVL